MVTKPIFESVNKNNDSNRLLRFAYLLYLRMEQATSLPTTVLESCGWRKVGSCVMQSQVSGIKFQTGKVTLSETVDNCCLYFQENVGMLYQPGPQSLLSISSFPTDMNRSTVFPHINVHVSSCFAISAELFCDI